MSKSKRTSSTNRLAIRGVFFNWLGRGCSLVITFFLTPYLVHTLGNEQYGFWAIVMSLTSYYALADMGLRSAGTIYIAKFAALDDRESLSKIVVTSLAVYSLLAALIVVAAFIVAWVFPYVFPLAGISHSTVRYIVLLTGGTVVFRLISQVFNATLTGLQRHDISNIAAITAQVTQALAVVAVLRAGGGLLGMAVATLCVAVVAQITRSLIAARLLPGLSLSWKYFDRGTLKLVFRFGTITTATRVARRMAQRAGSIIIGLFLGPAAVTYYAIPESLATKAEGLGSAIINVIDPLASRLDAQGDQRRLMALLVLGPRVLLAMSLSMGAVFFVMGRRFIDLWIGEGYSELAYPVLCLLSVALVARVSSNPLRAILRGTTRIGTLAKASCVEVILTLLFGPFLVWQVGLVGMAWAVLVAQVAVGGVILPITACRVMGFPFPQYLRQVWPSALLVGCLAVSSALALFWSWTPLRTLHLLCQALVVAAVSGLGAFLLCLDRGQRGEVVRAFWRKRRRRTGAIQEHTATQVLERSIST